MCLETTTCTVYTKLQIFEIQWNTEFSLHLLEWTTVSLYNELSSCFLWNEEVWSQGCSQDHTLGRTEK